MIGDKPPPAFMETLIDFEMRFFYCIFIFVCFSCASGNSDAVKGRVIFSSCEENGILINYMENHLSIMKEGQFCPNSLNIAADSAEIKYLGDCNYSIIPRCSGESITSVSLYCYSDTFSFVVVMPSFVVRIRNFGFKKEDDGKLKLDLFLSLMKTSFGR